MHSYASGDMWHLQESKEVTDDIKAEGATLHEINENMQLCGKVDS